MNPFTLKTDHNLNSPHKYTDKHGVNRNYRKSKLEDNFMLET